MTHATHINDRDKNIFGFWLYIMSDCLLFASLFATFAVLRNNTAGFAGADELFSLPFILLETLILLFSSFTCGLALISVYRSQVIGAIAWFAITIILGASFVALEMYEFVGMLLEGHGPHTSAFLSAFFTLVGTHGLHVSLGLIWMLVTMIQIARVGFTEKVATRAICLALFWHFLDIVWIFIFSFVYILPLVL